MSLLDSKVQQKKLMLLPLRPELSSPPRFRIQGGVPWAWHSSRSSRTALLHSNLGYYVYELCLYTIKLHGSFRLVCVFVMFVTGFWNWGRFWVTKSLKKVLNTVNSLKKSKNLLTKIPKNSKKSHKKLKSLKKYSKKKSQKKAHKRKYSKKNY